MRRTATGLSFLLFILTTSAQGSADQAAQRAALEGPDCGYVCVFADSVGDRDLEPVLRSPDSRLGRTR